MLVGAYWVLYPGSPATRADRFIARLDSQCPGWRDGPFILQADCEQWNGDSGTVPSVTEINHFCDRLADRMPKLNPIVYAPKWVYGSKVSSLRYPLWASSYVDGSGTPTYLYPGDSSSRWGAYGGRGPSILQFTSSASIGGQSTCDANAFRGTLDELTSLLAPGWNKPPPPPPPIEEPDVELTDTYGDRGRPTRKIQDRLRDDAGLRDVLWGDQVGATAANLDPNSPLAQLIEVPGRLTELEAAVAALASAGQTVVDQAALNDAVYEALKRLAADAATAATTP